MNRFKNKSKLKSKLKNKEITIGSWITISSTEIIEILSSAGFEWLVIDMEHTSISIDQCKLLIQTIQANNMDALVRVPENNQVIIKKVLDCGADGIIVPLIKSKEEANKAVSLTQYPPEGGRGVGLNRAHNYGINFKDYYSWSKNEIVLIAQIEHIDSVKNIDEILSVNGLDAALIGPYDLSSSMGFPGDYNKKEVINALNEVELKIKKSNVSLGFHVIESDYNFSFEKIKKGYNLIAFSIDFFFLGDKAREEMRNFKNHLKKIK